MGRYVAALQGTQRHHRAKRGRLQRPAFVEAPQIMVMVSPVTTSNRDYSWSIKKSDVFKA